MNIVEMCKQYLSGDLLTGLGRLIGEDADKTRAAVGAAIPAMLAGMSSVAGSGADGARRLNDAVDSVDDDLLGDASGALTSGNGAKLIDRGRELLGSVMGGNALSSIGGALGRFLGIGSGSMLGLLGGIAPVVLAVLRRAKSTMNLDARGLANMLGGQRDNIAAAMPAGLASALSGVSGLGDLSQYARGAVGAATGAARRAGEYAGSAARDAGAGARDAFAGARPKSAVPWIAALLGLAVLGGLIWWLASRSTPRVQPDATVRSTPAVTPDLTPTTGPADALPAAATITGAAADQLTRVTTDVKDVIEQTTRTLTSITDAASADAALPKLRELSTKLDGVNSGANTLPADARRSVASLISPTLDKIKDLANKTLAIPGVADRLRPVLDPMLQKLQTLANI